MQKILLFTFLLVLPLGVFSQNFIQGRLLDSVSNTPIVFASIVLKGSSKGVISNEDGSFRIPADHKSENSTLIISSMGYESLSVLMKDLSDEGLNTIYLIPKTIELQEATVVGYSDNSLARRIVRKAVRAIPRNFSKEPFSLVGYYRDYQQDKGEYLNLNESIVEVQDKGFRKKDANTTKYRIYRLVKNQDFPRDSISSLSYDYENHNKTVKRGYLPSYHGNELVILRVHDAIRNYNIGSYSFIENMKRDLLDNHEFEMGNDVYLDGKWLYTVNFETLKRDVRAQGQMIVSKKDFSIYGLDYAAYQLHGARERNDLDESDASQLIFQIQSEYRPFQEKMYLNYLSFSNSFTVRLPPSFMLDNVEVDSTNKVIWFDFNNAVNVSSAMDKEHYELYFKEREVPFEILTGHGEDKKVLIKPLFASEREQIAYYESLKTADHSNTMVYKIKGLIDVYGNMLGHSEEKDYLQYREFFTQRIIQGDYTGNGVPMDTGKPLFDNVVRAESIDLLQKYWMNTPLKEEVKLPE